MEQGEEVEFTESSNDSLMKSSVKPTPSVQLVQDTFQQHTSGDSGNLISNVYQQGLPFSVYPGHSNVGDERQCSTGTSTDVGTDVKDEWNAPTCNDSCDALSEYFETENDFKDGFRCLTEYLGEKFDSPCSDEFQEILVNDFLGIADPLSRSKSWNNISIENDMNEMQDVFFDCSPLFDHRRDQRASCTGNLRHSDNIGNSRGQTANIPNSSTEAEHYNISNIQGLGNLARYLNNIDTSDDHILTGTSINKITTLANNTLSRMDLSLLQERSPSTSSFGSALEEQVKDSIDPVVTCADSFRANPNSKTVLDNTITSNQKPRTGGDPLKQVPESNEMVKSTNNEKSNQDYGEVTFISETKSNQVPNKSSIPAFVSSVDDSKELSSRILSHRRYTRTQTDNNNTCDKRTNFFSTIQHLPSRNEGAECQKESARKEEEGRLKAEDTIHEMDLDDQKSFMIACSNDEIPEFSNEVEILDSNHDNPETMSNMDTDEVDAVLQDSVDATKSLNILAITKLRNTVPTSSAENNPVTSCGYNVLVTSNVKDVSVTSSAKYIPVTSSAENIHAISSADNTDATSSADYIPVTSSTENTHATSSAQTIFVNSDIENILVVSDATNTPVISNVANISVTSNTNATPIISNEGNISEESDSLTIITSSEHATYHSIPLTKSSYLNALRIAPNKIENQKKSMCTQSLASNKIGEHCQTTNTEKTNLVAGLSEDESSEAYERKISNKKFENDIFQWFQEKKEREMRKRPPSSPTLPNTKHLRLQDSTLQESQKPVSIDGTAQSKSHLNADVDTVPSSPLPCSKVPNDIEVDPQPSTSGIALISRNLRSNSKKKRRNTEPVRTYMTRDRTRRSMNEKGNSGK